MLCSEAVISTTIPDTLGSGDNSATKRSPCMLTLIACFCGSLPSALSASVMFCERPRWRSSTGVRDSNFWYDYGGWV
jgi:hypothetical protein